MPDVVVIGGGPAGALTARLLAERGHEVVVLEEHEAIGLPVHCTGLLGMEAFAEFNLPRSLILAEAGTARFWGTAGQSVPLRGHRANAAVIDRRALDEHLVQRATAAGARVVLGARADSVTVGPAGVAVSARGLDRPVEARLAVLACGANYKFHRQLGLGLPDLYLQSAQVETPFPGLSEIEVQFGRTVAPAGFAWMVPFRRGGADFARIGLMSETRSAERFSAFVGSLSQRVGVDPSKVPEPHRKMLPLGPVRRSFTDRVVAVGDAAGLVKPTTGGGIYYGMLSGQLAAEVIADGLARNRLDARTLKQYEVRWRRRLGQEIRVGLAFRRIAAGLSDESIDELIDLARLDGLAPLLQETASFNWHRKAAIALLGHPAVRRVVFRSWTRSADPL